MTHFSRHYLPYGSKSSVLNPKIAYSTLVEYVKRAGNGWNVVGDGIFARNREDLPPENPEGGIEENATLSVNQNTNA